ncbi:MAG: hypothetical protein HRT58_22550 [Crocinitomicaceae bacterium]|nr:hypothetical protein [Flavobacteriales bacterium]NQZ38459.1 hypothetical protein [Crocinitomicaceae bacterium]
MTRRMIITINNEETAQTWLLEDEKDKTFLKHGKWMDGSPVKSIQPYSQVQLKSEKQTGASYGTTGQATYKSEDDNSCTLLIKWNKPYGTDATTCTVSTTCSKYSVTVENKDFQQSVAKCDVVIKKI